MDNQFVLSNSVHAYTRARLVDSFQAQVVPRFENGHEEGQYNEGPKSKLVWSNFMKASVAGRFHTKAIQESCFALIFFLEPFDFELCYNIR
jgi:hypothetical protein